MNALIRPVAVAALLGMILFPLPACQSGTLRTNTEAVSLIATELDAPDLIVFLSARRIPIRRTEANRLNIRNSETCQVALLSFLRAMTEREELILENIANSDSVGRPGDPESVYARRELLFKSDGSWMFVQDQTNFVVVMMPEHPSADSSGAVIRTNVNVQREEIDLARTRQQYQVARNILQRFDPTIIDLPEARPIRSIPIERPHER